MQHSIPSDNILSHGVFPQPVFCARRAALNAGTTLLLSCVFILAIKTGAPAAQKQAAAASSGDSLVMTSASATYSIDNESFSMPGPVKIELPDTLIAGRDLSFNNKTGLGSLRGDPITVSYSRGGKSVLAASDLTFDSKNQTAKLSGNVSAQHSTGTITADFHAASVDFDFRLSILEASGKVTLTVSDSAAVKINADAPADEKKKKSPFDFATSPAVFIADYIRYNMKTGDALTGDNPTATLPDAVLYSRGPIKASLKNKTVTADNGIDLRAGKDITARAGNVAINYADSVAILSGGVTGSRGNDFFSAGAVRIEYPKTGSVIYFTGGVEIKVSTGDNRRDKIEPGLRGGPCPGGNGVFKPQSRNCRELEP